MIDELQIPSTLSELRSIFKGPGETPFLAPRGIWIHEGKLFVSDTGQNRVFIWNAMPESEFESPDIVLGQQDENDTARNANQNLSASSLHYPSGLWSDGKKLVVADAWNHRVLIWNDLPTVWGQPADLVLGQKDFGSNEPNVEGLNSECSSKSLYWPYGVHSDGQQLWIADTGNRRVLYFETFPTENFAAADQVIGKESFSSRDYDTTEPIWPYSVRVSNEGCLSITDTQCFRVLLWKDWKTATGSAGPDQIIGQPDLTALGQNQYGLTPGSQSLNWCYDSFFYKGGILVMDTANSRVKWHSKLFDGDNPVAEGLLGQPNFTTGSENTENASGTEATLYWPFALCEDNGLLAIADTGNHRILLNQMTL